MEKNLRHFLQVIYTNKQFSIFYHLVCTNKKVVSNNFFLNNSHIPINNFFFDPSSITYLLVKISWHFLSIYLLSKTTNNFSSTTTTKFPIFFLNNTYLIPTLNNHWHWAHSSRVEREGECSGSRVPFPSSPFFFSTLLWSLFLPLHLWLVPQSFRSPSLLSLFFFFFFCGFELRSCSISSFPTILDGSPQICGGSKASVSSSSVEDGGGRVQQRYNGRWRWRNLYFCLEWIPSQKNSILSGLVSFHFFVLE